MNWQPRATKGRLRQQASRKLKAITSQYCSKTAPTRVFIGALSGNRRAGAKGASRAVSTRWAGLREEPSGVKLNWRALVGHQHFVDDQDDAITLHDVGNRHFGGVAFFVHDHEVLATAGDG